MLKIGEFVWHKEERPCVPSGKLAIYLATEMVNVNGSLNLAFVLSFASRLRFGRGDTKTATPAEWFPVTSTRNTTPLCLSAICPCPWRPPRFTITFWLPSAMYKGSSSTWTPALTIPKVSGWLSLCVCFLCTDRVCVCVRVWLCIMLEICCLPFNSYRFLIRFGLVQSSFGGTTMVGLEGESGRWDWVSNSSAQTVLLGI